MAWLACSACTGPGLEPPKDPFGNHVGDSGTIDEPGAAGTASVPAGGAGGGAGGAVGGMTGSAGTGVTAGLGGMDSPSSDASVEPPDDDLDGGADGGTTYETEELDGPTYLGSVNNGADCATSYATSGHQPISSERHPLFLYFVGTDFTGTDVSAEHDSPAPMAVTQAMARRGFVSLSVQYDNGALAWLSDHGNQLACLFGSDKPMSALNAACALPNVDCDLGIATWGHSQGAYVAAMAYNREPRVRAVWTTGYGGDAATTLPTDRLRVVNGEADAADNGTAAKLNMITGLSAGECPMPDQCLRADGSGWIIVRVAELAMPATSTADHCWFDRPSCSATAITLEPSWVDADSDKPFALELNANWVARTVRR